MVGRLGIDQSILTAGLEALAPNASLLETQEDVHLLSHLEEGGLLFKATEQPV